MYAVRLIFAIWAGLNTLMVFSQESDTTVKTLPNIVVIISNGHGAGDAGCYGNKSINTPNIDKLADNGIRMDYAYDASACNSSNFSVILTGMMCHATGQYGEAYG